MQYYSLKEIEFYIGTITNELLAWGRAMNDYLENLKNTQKWLIKEHVRTSYKLFNQGKSDL